MRLRPSAVRLSIWVLGPTPWLQLAVLFVRGANLVPVSARRSELYRTAGYGHTPEYLAQWKDRPAPPNRGSAVGRAAAEGTIVHIPDVFEDPEYTSWDF